MKFNGPRPLPLPLKLLRGNPGKRRLPKQSLRPATGAVCPQWLSAEAKAEWNRIVPELERLGLLTRIDQACLVCYCEAYSDFKKAARELARQGLTLKAGNGTRIPHPAVQMKRASMKQVREFSAEFGLSPAARARLEIPGAEVKPDDEQDFFGPRPSTPPPPKKKGR